MRPLPRFGNVCDAQFAIGEKYRLGIFDERTQTSHGHYFASIRDAWASLPESYSDQFPTEEHLRKWALIKTGYYDEHSIVAASHEEALRIAAFIEPQDKYAVIVVSDSVVTVYKAQSQSMKAMGRKAFQSSKWAVINYLSGLIGVSAQVLSRNAGMAA